MAATFDTRFEKGFSSQSSPASFVSNAGDVTGTVSATADRVMIAFVGATTSLTSLAVTWDGTPLSPIGTPLTFAAGFVHYMFGLINPINGNKTLAASWSSGAADVVLGAISSTASDQSTGWQNATNSSLTTSTAPTITIPSASGNLAVAMVIDNNSSSATISGSATSAWNERDLNGNYNAGYLASSSASTIIAWTLGSSVEWGVRGVDIIAKSSGTTFGPLVNGGSITHGGLIRGGRIAG